MRQWESFSVEGFKELDDALENLTKGAGKAALRKGARAALEPMAEIARSLAPDDPETGGRDLKASITVGTVLSKRQRGLHRKMFRNDKASVEMFMGAGTNPAAHTQEFGTIRHGPQPFMRPAWDQDKNAMLERLKADLWASISAAVKRANRKAARAAAKAARGQ